MKLRKILTVLLIAAAFSTAALGITANAADDTPVPIAVVLYGEDEAGNYQSCTIMQDFDYDGMLGITIPLDLNGFTVIVNGNVTQAADINIGSGKLIVNGDYHLTKGSLTFGEGGSLTVTGNMDVHKNINTDKGTLTVGGNYIQDSGKLTIGSGKMTVDGNFRFQSENGVDSEGNINYTASTAVLNMTDDNGYLCIGGDMYMYSTQNNTETANYITAGTLELKGNFNQGYSSANFDAKGTHKLILSGEDKQTIKFEYPNSSGFNILYSTPNENTDIKGRIAKANDGTAVFRFDQYQDLDLEGNSFTVYDDMTAHGNININIGKLDIKGNYLQDSGKLTIGAGKMDVGGNFRFQYENGLKSDGSINYTASTAVLNMTDDKGYLRVCGDMYMYSTQNNTETANYITAGTLELKGNFSQGYTSNNFDAKGSNKLILSGTAKQIITFNNPDSSGFNILYSTPNKETHIKGRIAKIGADTEVGSFEQHQNLDLNGKTFKVIGKLYAFGNVKLSTGTLNVGEYTQCSGSLDFQSGRLNVEKDFRFQYENGVDSEGNINYTSSTAYMKMTGSKGYLCVGGDMYFYSTRNNTETANYITAGTIELKGNFKQGDTSNNFDAKGSNKLILSGTAKQTITFNSPNSSGFNILYSTPNTNTHVCGRIAKIAANTELGSFEQYQSFDLNGKTLTVNGKLYAHGNIDLNGGILNAGEFVQNGGKLEVKNGKMYVKGDLRFQHEGSINADGSINYTASTAVINMTDINGYISVGGNMYMYSTKNDAETSNYITAGTLELKGNFEQGYTSSNFNARGTHITIFSGTGTQTADFNGRGSCFNILDISRNPLAAGVAAAPHRLLITTCDLTNCSMISAAEVNVGELITITGFAAGGGDPYTYSYYYKKADSSSWTAIGINVSSNFAFFTPNAAGIYEIKVIATDKNGTSSVKNFTVTVNEVTTLQNTSVINSDTVQVGDKVRMSASASGGTGPYKYAYYYKRSTNTKWNVLGTEFGTNSSVTFTPTAEATYDVKIIVMDADGTTAEKTFTVKAVNTLPLTNVSTIYSTKVKVGSAVKLTGKAVGGTSPYTYAFYFKRSTNSNWKVLGTEFSSTATARLKPTAAGEYDFKVVVKDAAGNKEIKTFKVTAY